MENGKICTQTRECRRHENGLVRKRLHHTTLRICFMHVSLREYFFFYLFLMIKIRIAWGVMTEIVFISFMTQKNSLSVFQSQRYIFTTWSISRNPYSCSSSIHCSCNATLHRFRWFYNMKKMTIEKVSWLMLWLLWN